MSHVVLCCLLPEESVNILPFFQLFVFDLLEMHYHAQKMHCILFVHISTKLLAWEFIKTLCMNCLHWSVENRRYTLWNTEWDNYTLSNIIDVVQSCDKYTQFGKLCIHGKYNIYKMIIIIANVVPWSTIDSPWKLFWEDVIKTIRTAKPDSAPS